MKPDYALPDTLEYEILAELFIPDELEEDAENGRLDVDVTFLRTLEDEALRITNNWEEPLDLTRVRNPSGKLRVQERIGNRTGSLKPVKGVRVRVRRWFTIKTDYTDAGGNYRISKNFNRDVNYSIVFRTPRFRVTNGTGSSVRFNGPRVQTRGVQISNGIPKTGYTAP